MADFDDDDFGGFVTATPAPATPLTPIPQPPPVQGERELALRSSVTASTASSRWLWETLT